MHAMSETMPARSTREHNGQSTSDGLRNQLEACENAANAIRETVGKLHDRLVGMLPAVEGQQNAKPPAPSDAPCPVASPYARHAHEIWHNLLRVNNHIHGIIDSLEV